MKKLLLKLVNGEVAEWPRISRLLGIGFFTGIFVATYDVTITSLFLEYFDEETDIPRAVIATGIAGIISTLIFQTLQRFIGFKYTTLSIFVLIILGVGFITAAINIGNIESYMVFAAFVALGPLNALIILSFWILFGRLFTVRQTKRLAGGIDTGQAFATIFAFFGIIIYQTFIAEETKALLLVSFGCVIFCLILYVAVFRKFQLVEPEVVKVEKRRKEEKSWKGQRRYIFLMAIFVIMSAIAARFVLYSFLTVTEDYFDTEKQKATFLSSFGALVMIMAFLVQTFANDKILEIFGLKWALLLLPIMLIFFGVISTIAGFVFGYDSVGGGDSFLFFFILIVISKLVTDALRDSLESPTVKFFFLPIDASKRFNIQTSIEGVVKESATLMAGLLMSFLASFAFYDILYNNYALFVIIIIWAIVTFFLHTDYKNALTTSLKTNRPKREYLEQSEQLSVPRYLSRQLERTEGVLQKVVVNIMDKIDPFLYRSSLLSFALFDSQDLQVKSLNQIASLKLFDATRTLRVYTKTARQHKVRNTAELVFEDLKRSRSDANSLELVLKLASSQNAKDRFYAVRLIDYTYSDNTFNSLILLLRDFSLDVRKEALLVAGRHKVLDAISIVVEHLSILTFENVAVASLMAYGEAGLYALEVAFYKNGQSQRAMLNIVDIYGRIGGERAIELLLDKIEYPDKVIVYRVFQSLYVAGWHADENSRIYVKGVLMEECAKMIWNYAALEEIKKDEYHDLLQDALNHELEENLEHFFLYLSLLYDKQSVLLVKSSLMGGTADSIGYALELLDIFVEDDLKRKVIPVLDDIPTGEKLRKLEGDFPREPLSEIEVLLQIMNRDINQINRWTKACAMYAYSHMKEGQMQPDLIAQLFNPDPLLHELAAWLVHSLSPYAFNQYLKRVDPEISSRLELMWKKHDNENILAHLEFSEIRYLFEVDLLKGLNGTQLSAIADGIHEFNLLATQKHTIEIEQNKKDFIFVIKIGSINIKDLRTGRELLFEEGQLVVSFLFDFSVENIEITALTNSIVWELDLLNFYKVIASSPRFTSQFLLNLSENDIEKHEVAVLEQL